MLDRSRLDNVSPSGRQKVGSARKALRRRRIRRSVTVHAVRRRLGWTLIVASLALLVGVLAVFTFSIRVEGHSMNPNVHSGDRLMVNFLARHDIRRFDLVEATMGGSAVVKRVIGMPGDRIRVETDTSTVSVLVRPSGSSGFRRVDSSAWADQVGPVRRPCCTTDGRDSSVAAEVTVPDGQYWLIGDNWGDSKDSRAYGFIPATAIGARLNFRVWPLSRFGRVANPAMLTPLA